LRQTFGLTEIELTGKVYKEALKYYQEKTVAQEKRFLLSRI
jgi:hypothetical protein